MQLKLSGAVFKLNIDGILSGFDDFFERVTTVPSSEISSALSTIHNRLDEYVIGQQGVKEALMLALIGREHLYLQGEPGCAKTLMAEVVGNTANLTFQFCQMHRDTRLSELIGNVVLERSPGEGQRAEVIRQCLQPGGVLTSELALLDDISRAPGEALNVLLRILNEREFNGRGIPLMTAIATSNPTSADYYNEPLDPANLDRFTLQMKIGGAVASQDWDSARRIMDRYDGAHPDFTLAQAVDGDLLRRASRVAAEVKLPRPVVDAYQRFLDTLRNRYNCNQSNSLLTDRTMLIKVPRMIKALALLEGRGEAIPEDLRVLKYILTFRIPEQLFENLDQILDQVIQEAQEAEDLMPQQGEEMQGAQGQEETGQAGDDSQEQEGGGEEDLIEQILEAVEAQGEEARKRKAMQQQSSSPQDGPGKVERNPPQQVVNLEFLLEKVRGRLERNQADSEVHPGGSPRSYKRMHTFEEFIDSDPVDTAIWMDSINPNLPRAFRRKKKHTGGKVVIIRDVSQSMEGRYARWTSSVVTKLVDMVRRKRMRIGYIEFNHISRKYTHDGRFFTRDYEKIVDQAANVSCSGVTNYQYPLRDALHELRRGNNRNKHILFLTDGEPTQGDWLVREERRQAKTLGVSIHTLFIGTTECPEILDILSEETDGSQFLATPDERGGLVIGERPIRNQAERPLGQPVPTDPGGPRRGPGKGSAQPWKN
jgi:MoxR-like ATPase